MTYAEIMQLMQKIGLPYAYDHYAEGDSPDLPYIVFMLPERFDFKADDRIYTKITALTIELYTDYKDPATEASIESVLDEYEIIYDKTESWIISEELYQVVYEMEVVYDG